MSRARSHTVLMFSCRRFFIVDTINKLAQGHAKQVLDKKAAK